MPTEPITRQPNVNQLEISWRFGLLIIMTGAGAGLAGGLLMKLLRFVQHLSFHYQAGDFISGASQASNERRVLALLLAGILAGVVLFLVHRFWAGTGGGLNEAIWTGSGHVAAKPTLVQSLLSIIIVGMGVSLGREGALKDTGGVIANKLADWLNSWVGLTPAQWRLLLACGSGAGMAAAYNVPLGGALFAAEVLIGSLSMSVIIPAFIACFTAVAVSWLLLPNEPAYTVPPLSVSASLVGWSILIGPLVGFISVFYVRAVGWAQNHRPKGWSILWLPVLAFTLIGFVSVKFPQILGNGKGIVQLTFNDQIGLGLLCWLTLLRPIATVLCLRTGAPGGLFTPTMTFGALVGDLFGSLWNQIAPGNSLASYALIGSAAMLGAATLGPLSSAVFLLELTRRADSLMVPLLIATAGATIVSRRLDARSIYSVHSSTASEVLQPHTGTEPSPASAAD